LESSAANRDMELREAREAFSNSMAPFLFWPSAESARPVEICPDRQASISRPDPSYEGNLVELKLVQTATIGPAIKNFATGMRGHREEVRKRQMYTFYPHIVHKIALSHSGRVRYLAFL
jgi:hypothetical protein